MTDANQSTIQQIKVLIQSGEKITTKTRDLLLFTAIVDIYEKINTIEPAMTFYRVSMWATTAAGLALIGLLISGRVEIVIK